MFPMTCHMLGTKALTSLVLVRVLHVAWLAVPKAGAAGIFQQMSGDRGEKERLHNNAEVMHTKIIVFIQSSGA